MKSGIVVWITGLSGSGKSTIARTAAGIMRAQGVTPVVLDGDEFRAAVGDDLGHDHEGRLKNAYRLARFADYLARQDHIVLCATMSLFHEVRAWNRANAPRYLEVYVRVSLEKLIERDPKGLYARARGGLVSGVVGVDLPFSEPAAPDLVLDNEEPREHVVELAEQVVGAIRLISS
jgi:adenylylsulfate kinase